MFRSFEQPKTVQIVVTTQQMFPAQQGFRPEDGCTTSYSSLGIPPSPASLVQQLVDAVLQGCSQSFLHLLKFSRTALCSPNLQSMTAAEAQLATTAILHYAARTDASGTAVTDIVQFLLLEQPLVMRIILQQAMQSTIGRERPWAAAANGLLTAVASWCAPSCVQLAPSLWVELINTVAHHSHLLVQGLRHPNPATRLLAGQLLVNTSQTPTGQLVQQGQLVEILAALADQSDNTLANCITVVLANVLQSSQDGNSICLIMASNHGSLKSGLDSLVMSMLKDNNVNAATAICCMASTAFGWQVLAPYVPRLLEAVQEHETVGIAGLAARAIALLASGGPHGRAAVQFHTSKLLNIAAQHTHTNNLLVVAAACEALLALSKQTICIGPLGPVHGCNWWVIRRLITPSSLRLLFQICRTPHESNAKSITVPQQTIPWLASGDIPQAPCAAAAGQIVEQLAQVAAAEMEACLLRHTDLLQGLFGMAMEPDNQASCTAVNAINTLMQRGSRHPQLLQTLAIGQNMDAVMDGLQQGNNSAAAVLELLAQYPELDKALLPYMGCVIACVNHQHKPLAHKVCGAIKQLCDRPLTRNFIVMMPSHSLLPLVQAMTPQEATTHDFTAAVAAGKAAAAVISLAGMGLGQKALMPHLNFIIQSLVAYKRKHSLGCGTAGATAAAAAAAEIAGSKDGFQTLIGMLQAAVLRLKHAGSTHNQHPACSNQPGYVPSQSQATTTGWSLGAAQPQQPVSQPEAADKDSRTALDLSGASLAHSVCTVSAENAQHKQDQGSIVANGISTSSNMSRPQLSAGSADDSLVTSAVCDILAASKRQDVQLWLARPSCICLLLEAVVHSATSNSAVTNPRNPQANIGAAPGGAGGLLLQLMQKQIDFSPRITTLIAEQYVGQLVAALQQGSTEPIAVLAAVCEAPAIKQHLIEPVNLVPLLNVLVLGVTDDIKIRAAAVLGGLTVDKIPLAALEHTDSGLHVPGVQALAQQDVTPLINGLLDCKVYSSLCAITVHNLAAHGQGRVALAAHIQRLIQASAALSAAGLCDTADEVLSAVANTIKCPRAAAAAVECIDQLMTGIGSTNMKASTAAGLNVLAELSASEHCAVAAATKLAEDSSLSQLLGILAGNISSSNSTGDGGAGSEDEADSVESAACILCNVSVTLSTRHKVLPHAELLISMIKQGTSSRVTPAALEDIASSLLLLSSSATEVVHNAAAAAQYDEAAACTQMAQLDVTPVVDAALQQEEYSAQCAGFLHNLCLTPAGASTVMPYTSRLVRALESMVDDELAVTIMDTLGLIAEDHTASRQVVILYITVLIDVVQRRKLPQLAASMCRIVCALLQDPETRSVVVQHYLSRLLPVLMQQIAAQDSRAAESICIIAEDTGLGEVMYATYVGQLLQAVQPIAHKQQLQHLQGQQMQEGSDWSFQNDIVASYVIKALRWILAHHPERYDDLARQAGSVLGLLQCHVTAAEADAYEEEHDLRHPLKEAFYLVLDVLEEQAGASNMLMQPQHLDVLLDRLLTVVQKRSAAILMASSLLQKISVTPNGQAQLSRHPKIVAMFPALSARHNDPTARQVAAGVYVMLQRMATATAAKAETPIYTAQMLSAAKQWPDITEPVVKCLAVMSTYRPGQLHLAQHTAALAQLAKSKAVTATAKSAINDLQQVITAVVSDLEETLRQSELGMVQKAVLLSVQYKEYRDARCLVTRSQAAAAVLQQMATFHSAHLSYSRLQEQLAAK